MIARAHDLRITRWSAQFMGREFPCAIGHGGIGQKRGEGDGITPEGQFEIHSVLIRPDRLDVDCPAVLQSPIGISDIWSDDPRDPDYNQRKMGLDDRYGHERLRRADPLYDLIGVLDYNFPKAIPGKGSAIFLHVWRKPRHPTEGCVAFDPRDLAFIFQNWTVHSRVIIR